MEPSPKHTTKLSLIRLIRNLTVSGTKPGLLVMSGLPGSGKSTIVDLIRDVLDDTRYHDGMPIPLPVRVVSADKFFVDDDGVYRFDPAKLNENHKKCLRAALECMDDTNPYNHFDGLLIVDNTNLMAAEASPYMALGNLFGYQTAVLGVECNPYQAFSRCQHGVPADKFASMVEVYKYGVSTFPMWWKTYTLGQDGVIL